MTEISPVSTYDNGHVKVYGISKQTTDDTFFHIKHDTITDNIYMITYVLVQYNETDGTYGTTEIFSSQQNIEGTLSLAGSNEKNQKGTVNNISITRSGTEIRCRFRGAASKTINWDGYIEIVHTENAEDSGFSAYQEMIENNEYTNVDRLYFMQTTTGNTAQEHGFYVQDGSVAYSYFLVCAYRYRDAATNQAYTTQLSAGFKNSNSGNLQNIGTNTKTQRGTTFGDTGHTTSTGTDMLNLKIQGTSGDTVKWVGMWERYLLRERTYPSTALNEGIFDGIRRAVRDSFELERDNDATTVTAYAFTTTSNNVYHVKVTYAQRNEANNNYATLTITGAFQNHAGTLTKIGTNTTESKGTPDGVTYSLEEDDASDEIRLRITGVSGKTFQWTGNIEIVTTQFS